MRSLLRPLPIVLGLSAFAGCHVGDAPRGPASQSPAPSSAAPASLGLDALVDAEWKAAGVAPAAEIDDATFLRRVSLDLLGRVATAAEYEAFAADARADKRARLVDAALDSPEHARHLARSWERLLMGPEVKNRVADRGAMRRWLEDRFARDVPWDQMVREIVAAEGKSSVGGDRGPAMFADSEERAEEERTEGVNGATNFTLRFGQKPADLAGTASRVFLGVQIQCAQCHDHKTESWKQADFRGFESAFIHLKADVVARGKKEVPVIAIANDASPNRRIARRSEDPELTAVAPRALDGTSLAGDSPRSALAGWMTARENPWFSRAIVNRVWADLMGGGFVEPIDDFRPSNPAVMAPVLDWLAEDFEASGYDLDHLYATICGSSVYARALGGGAETPRAARFAHQALRPIDSDQLLDSIYAATEADALLAARAPEQAETIKAVIRRRMGFVFEADSEANGEASEPTLQQAFFTMNGPLPVAASSLRRGSPLAELVRKGDDALVRELFLRTLGREPSADDLAAAKTFLHAERGDDPAPPDSPRGGKGKGKGKKAALSDPKALVKVALRSDADTDRERGAEDLFWALINSSEFGLRR